MPSITITITTINTKFRLIDLITGTNGAGASAPANAPYALAHPACKDLNIQNMTPGTNLDIGDAKISATNRGIRIPGGDSYTYPATMNDDIALTNKYILTDINPTVVNLNWEYA